MENLEERKSALFYLSETCFLVLIILILSYLNLVISSKFYVVLSNKISMLMTIPAIAIILCMVWVTPFYFAFPR